MLYFGVTFLLSLSIKLDMECFFQHVTVYNLSQARFFRIYRSCLNL